jgi:hypothetical protein
MEFKVGDKVLFEGRLQGYVHEINSEKLPLYVQYLNGTFDSFTTDGKNARGASCLTLIVNEFKEGDIVEFGGEMEEEKARAFALSEIKIDKPNIKYLGLVGRPINKK